FVRLRGAYAFHHSLLFFAFLCFSLLSFATIRAFAPSRAPFAFAFLRDNSRLRAFACAFCLCFPSRQFAPSRLRARLAFYPCRASTLQKLQNPLHFIPILLQKLPQCIRNLSN